MPEQGSKYSRNPNICASCSSLLDGMDENTPPAVAPVATMPENQSLEPQPTGALLLPVTKH
jgi:hypothetical protein